MSLLGTPDTPLLPLVLLALSTSLSTKYAIRPIAFSPERPIRSKLHVSGAGYGHFPPPAPLGKEKEGKEKDNGEDRPKATTIVSGDAHGGSDGDADGWSGAGTAC